MTGHARRTPSAGPLLAWLPVMLWAGAIFAVSAQPDLRIAPDASVDFVVRKIGHMGVFGVQALLVWRALAATSTVSRPWAWALSITVLYAITDGLHQGTVAGHHASALDVGIDTVGAIAAVAATAAIRTWTRPRPG